MTTRPAYPSSLARTAAKNPTNAEGLEAMRRAAWRHQGVIMLRPEEIQDDWTRQALVIEAERLYGRRPLGSSSPQGDSLVGRLR